MVRSAGTTTPPPACAASPSGSAASPTADRPPHLGHHHLDAGGRLVRTRHRPVRPVRQTRQLIGQIPGHAPVLRGPMHPHRGRHLGDLRTR